ncbi:hypothetical protein Ddc_09815 [Ditylenchus destructor]|nr:hypothetical protein Ddc_09815 [Ditylenchus destructor]
MSLGLSIVPPDLIELDLRAMLGRDEKCSPSLMNAFEGTGKSLVNRIGGRRGRSLETLGTESAGSPGQCYIQPFPFSLPLYISTFLALFCGSIWVSFSLKGGDDLWIQSIRNVVLWTLTIDCFVYGSIVAGHKVRKMTAMYQQDPRGDMNIENSAEKCQNIECASLSFHIA